MAVTCEPPLASLWREPLPLGYHNSCLGYFEGALTLPLWPQVRPGISVFTQGPRCCFAGLHVDRSSFGKCLSKALHGFSQPIACQSRQLSSHPACWVILLQLQVTSSSLSSGPNQTQAQHVCVGLLNSFRTTWPPALTDPPATQEKKHPLKLCPRPVENEQASAPESRSRRFSAEGSSSLPAPSVLFQLKMGHLGHNPRKPSPVLTGLDSVLLSFSQLVRKKTLDFERFFGSLA